jgi:hypothetical protein
MEFLKKGGPRLNSSNDGKRSRDEQCANQPSLLDRSVRIRYRASHQGGSEMRRILKAIETFFAVRVPLDRVHGVSTR